VPKGIVGKELYLIDFCYKKNIMLKLVEDNKKVVVLDHHITRKAEVRMVKEHVFDNFHSGAVIAWKYFFPKKRIPRLLLCVQDNDLWKFKVKKSKEIMLAVNLHPYSFDIWNRIGRDLENPQKRRHYEIQGDAIFKYVTMLAEEMSGLADEVTLNGVRALAVNAPRFIRSDLGNALTKKGVDVGIVWYIKGRKVHVSLRSNGRVDVSKLAEKYNGGGHERAAAFIFEIGVGKIFPWKPVK
jgi:oligoribonuclease NrnB/cAMP/cGMP phosphodiesterase (DHH superfamily)